MKKATISLYTIDELEEKARARAVASHKDLITKGWDADGLSEIFCSFESSELSDEETIENIKTNNYLFFANGRYAPVSYSMGEESLTLNGEKCHLHE